MLSSAPTFRATSWPVILFALVYPTLLTWVYFVALTGASETIQQAAYAIGKVIQFSLPVGWAGLIARELLGWPRPTLRGVGAGIGFGLLVGGGILSLYFGGFRSSGIFNSSANTMTARLAEIGVHSAAAYAVVAMFYSLAHSLLEEYYWRWFVFGQLRQKVRLAPAIAISSLGFMGHHVIVLGTYFGWASPWTWFFAAATAVGGAYWAWLYHRSNSIYGPWISHLMIDAAIFGVGYDLMRIASQGGG